VSAGAAITPFTPSWGSGDYRDVPLKTCLRSSESMVLVGGILVILGSALGLTNYLIDEEIPMKMFDLFQAHITSPLVFLMILNVFLLIVGCMMDIFSALVVVVPLMTPIAQAYGIHPVHLGIIFLANLQIGASTPPVGMNLFISSLRFEKPMSAIILSSLPFLVILMVTLALVTYVPWLSLAFLK
jgi:tripartite ATP-independent transporter DctM subunit